MKPKKIKILQTVASLHLGGFERVVANICEDIDDSKFDIAVACIKHTQGIIGKEIKEKGITVFDLSPKVNRTFSQYVTFLKLQKLISKNEFDIIHSHGTTGLIEGSLANICNPKSSYIHTFHFGNYPNRPFKRLIMEAILSRIPDKIVAVSKNQKERLAKTFKLKPDRINVVYNGVKEIEEKIDTTKLKEKFNIPVNSFLIGTVGNLIEQKGHIYLLKACKLIYNIFPETYFIIVGGGRLENELKDEAKKLRIENRVIFTGYNPEGAKIIKIFDIFVLASLWEAMPMVILEAMAAEKAVIATDVGENSRIVCNNITGFLIPSKNVEAIAEKIKILTVNKDLRLAMGIKGKARFKKYFSSKIMVNNYMEIYESLFFNKIT